MIILAERYTLGNVYEVVNCNPNENLIGTGSNSFCLLRNSLKFCPQIEFDLGMHEAENKGFD